MFASHKHPLANSHTSHGLFKEKSENDVQVKASGCIQVIKSKENITVFKQTIRLDASCYISHMYVHKRVKANYQAGCNIWLTLCIPYLYFVRKILLVNQNSHKIACNDSGQQNQKIKKCKNYETMQQEKEHLRKRDSNILTFTHFSVHATHGVCCPAEVFMSCEEVALNSEMNQHSTISVFFCERYMS